MNKKWKEFLVKNQEKFSTVQVDDLFNVSYLTNLPFFSLLTLSGKDVIEFLHGQFTTDIKLVQDFDLQFTAWCNAKGQVLNTLYLYKYDNQVNILIPVDVKDSFIKRLQLYILRSDVRIKDNDDIVIIGVKQVNNQSGNMEFLSESNTRPGSVLHQNSKIIIHLHGMKQRFIVMDNLDNMIILWKKLSENLSPVDCKYWTITDIQEGIPWISEKNKEQFLPQFLNLDHLDAVNYKKGCYPGQEIIARLHYRGKTKHRMYLCKTDKFTGAAAGDNLFVMEKESPVGKILNLQSITDKHELLLAVIETSVVNVQNIFINNNKDYPLHLQKLPYVINE